MIKNDKKKKKRKNERLWLRQTQCDDGLQEKRKKKIVERNKTRFI